MKLSTILICLGNTSVVSPRTRYNGVRELEYYYYDSKIIGGGEKPGLLRMRIRLVLELNRKQLS